jgi:UBX domain-containing protein 6
MSAIKRFFQRKKMDIKFKKAGEGHKLDQPQQRPSQPPQKSLSQPSPSSHQPVSPRETAMTEEKRRAAEAALSRMDQNQTKQGKNYIIVQSQNKVNNAAY